VTGIRDRHVTLDGLDGLEMAQLQHDPDLDTRSHPPNSKKSFLLYHFVTKSVP
jgi:hypothetical protein